MNVYKRVVEGEEHERDRNGIRTRIAEGISTNLILVRDEADNLSAYERK